MKSIVCVVNDQDEDKDEDACRHGLAGICLTTGEHISRTRGDGANACFRAACPQH